MGLDGVGSGDDENWPWLESSKFSDSRTNGRLESFASCEAVGLQNLIIDADSVSASISGLQNLIRVLFREIFLLGVLES